MFKIAIIGSGPTGIYTAQQLLRHDDPDISITMFELQSEAGKGTPYHQDWNDKEMLSNIASIEIPPVTETLVQWLSAQTDYALATMGIARDDINERTFFPRVTLGRYFQAQLDKLVRRATTRLSIKASHRITDVAVTDNGIMLKVRHKAKESQLLFDYVIMATGHAWPKQTEIKPGYFLSPWPASSLKTIQDCHVGIRGTSLSAIDACVALSTARGVFHKDEKGRLRYLAEPGTEAFRITMLSRKGVLPEADFYYPVPYRPLRFCTKQALKALEGAAHLLDHAYMLFKQELAACDPAYARSINLEALSLEEFSQAYFGKREQSDPFDWARNNLAEAKESQENKHVIEWRYAILRMHETLAHIVPVLNAEDYERFIKYFKPVFSDCYATVPHTSIERLLALHEAGKLAVIKAGENYVLDSESRAAGATLHKDGETVYFPAFIEAMGQHVLSLHEFPFPSLWEQGVIEKATTSQYMYAKQQWIEKTIDIGGIALDRDYHPVSGSATASQLYCLSLPFLLGQFPFAQGITSSYEMGKKVAEDISKQVADQNAKQGDAKPHIPLSILQAVSS